MNLSDSQIMDPKVGNATQITRFLIAFGFIRLPSSRAVEKDIVMGFVALMSFISMLVNGVLLYVIFKDPFKQLRTITAALLAFNSTASLAGACVLFLDNVFYWFGKKLSPELILYIAAFTAYLFIFGNFLHTINLCCAIVLPVRYAVLVPKIKKYLVQTLTLCWFVVFIVVIVPPSILPHSKRSGYAKVILTLICVLLIILSILFGCLYQNIFRSLHARNERLSLPFFLKRSTIQVQLGQNANKNNEKMVTTLFLHVTFFTTATFPSCIIFIVFLYCSTCNTASLAALFSIPIVYSPTAFLPLVWLLRLNNYKKAMMKIIFCQRTNDERNNGSSPNLDCNSRSVSCTRNLDIV